MMRSPEVRVVASGGGSSFTTRLAAALPL